MWYVHRNMRDDDSISMFCIQTLNIVALTFKHLNFVEVITSGWGFGKVLMMIDKRIKSQTKRRADKWMNGQMVNDTKITKTDLKAHHSWKDTYVTSF